MPELPEVEALAHHLRENAVYRPVARVDVAGMSVLKTFDPPVSALHGRVVTGAARYGKFLAVEFADRPDALHLITHLSRAGWLRWHETAAAAPPKPGRGPLQLRVHLDAVGGPGFDLTEAGTQKRLSVYLVADPQQVPGIARLGPDALALSRDELGELLAGRTERIKTLLTDQPTIAGIGNAYSDEILHTAKLSPYAVAGRLKPEQVDDLHAALRAVLTDAVNRSVGQGAATLKGEKRSGLRVHARTGPALPGVRGHCQGGVLRRSVVPVLSRLSDRWPAARRPQAVTPREVGAVEVLLGSPPLLVLLGVVVGVLATVVVVLIARGRRNTFATPLEKATFGTLHTVALAAPALREGLSPSSAAFALPYLRTLLDNPALAMTDSRGAVLAWDGDADHHEPDVVALADEVIRTGRQQVLSHNSIQCDRVDCEIRGIVVQPLEIEGSIVGTLAALTNQTAGPVLLRATGEVARYVSSQLELAELDESRARLNRAEVRALRAQISPHFVYNALTTIASFIRTDPVRARELLIEFADFTRYSFRTAGEYTTLKDELNNIERYIRLEKARFGDRLNIKLEIAPEVLSVVLPFLALQPLVENAVRHGLSGKPNGGTITITAENAGAECVIIVEDDGVGMDPARLTDDLEDAHQSGAHVGLGNVDDRMRSAFGDDFGLVVDTNVGAGMKITLRVPKFRVGIRV